MNYKVSMFNNIITNNTNENDFIIYNSFTGSIVNLNEASKLNYLELEKDATYRFSGLEDFLKQGIIVPIEQNEINKIIFYENQRLYSNGELFSLTIAPTLKCNYNCFYCFEHGSNSSDENLPEEEIVTFVKNKFKETKFKKFYVKWFGGEPLLKKDTILSLGEKLKKFCKSNDIYFYSSIITNGLFFTKQAAEELVEMSNLKGVQITLDGDMEDYCKAKQTNKKNYYEVLNNIVTGTLITKIHVRFNVTMENVSSIHSVIANIKSMCLNNGNIENLKFDIARVRDYSSLTGEVYPKYKLISTEFDDDNDYDKKYQSLKDIYNQDKIIKVRRTYCMERTASFYTIGPNGDLYKCPHFLGRKDKKIGNVAYGELFNDFSSEYLNLQYPSKCLSCSMLAVCFAGCPQQRITNINGDCLDCKKDILNDVRAFCKSYYDHNKKEKEDGNGSY